MIAFPNGKINLGLNILHKRPDGFHDLETVFYPVGIHDVLEIIPASDSATDDVSLTLTGSGIDGDNENNLCVRAYHALKKDFPHLSPVRMHLHKTIPVGAGLGGGSADASFTLKVLNTAFDLHLTYEQLAHYSAPLGSDCPFFILNKTCFASGKGEILRPLNVDLSRYQFILVNPGIRINTGHAFSQITPALPQYALKEIIELPATEWKNKLVNDFEIPVFRQYPEIGKIKDELYNAGAVYASMSGSGSTVYGIFEKEKNASITFPKHYFVKTINA